jgi:magnesium transporter
MDVAEEEADEDIYYMAGTEATELEETGARRAALIRLRWLSFCLVGTAVNAAVVCFLGGKFSPEISFALFLFVPMMGAMGGNAGIQISTIIIRSLASGNLESKRIGRDFQRELPISFIMAPACGLVAAALAHAVVPLTRKLFADGVAESVNVNRLSVSVGIGMTVGILTASLLAMSLPHLFRKIGVDPAIASGPIVTTANDIVSVSVYLSVATVIMGTRY